MKKIFMVMLAILFVAGVAFANGGQEASSDTLSGSVKIAGSSTVYPVSTAMAEEFHRQYTDVTTPIQSTGTGGGFKNFFIPGKTDVNNASRAIKESELAAARKNGIEPIEFQVATDAITIIVNKDADWLNNITIEQLAEIWRPKNPAQNWSDVNPEWPDKEIELYGPTSASGTFDYFTEEVVGEGGASRDDYQKTEQDNTIVQAVKGSKYAMGYFGMAYYLENTDRVKALSVNGVKPSIETAKSGKYTPLSRPLFIYVSKKSLNEKPEVEKFIRFYLDLCDDEIIKQIGYVPLTKDIVEKNMAKLESALQ